ncbi:basic proline-rich protein-like [Thrips palmi]|uniref:Basic proline-rich protein-like n=1 Tax=Thrips palmi TaxID=161013 RepID=A0A6P8ZSN8_THRPL|nr:basic proline-rich protein-like [Thrips palmi]
MSGRTCIQQVCSAACKRAGHVAARCRGGCQCRDRRAGKARHHNRHSRTDGDEEGGNNNNNYNVNYNVNAVMPIPIAWGGGGGGIPPYVMPPYGGTAPQQPMYPMYPQQGPPGMFPPGPYPPGMPPGQPQGPPNFMPPMGPAPTAPPSVSAAAAAYAAHAATPVSSYTSTALPWFMHAGELSKGHAVSSKMPPAMQPLVALPGLMAPTPSPPQAGLQPLAPAEPPPPLQPLGSGPAPFEGERERPSYALPAPGNVQPPSMLGAAAPGLGKPQPYFGGGDLRDAWTWSEGNVPMV